MTRYRFTRHAQERMAEFGLAPPEVIEVVQEFENCYSAGPRYPGDRSIYQRGAWAVVVQPDCRGPLVITVLRRSVEDWEHA